MNDGDLPAPSAAVSGDGEAAAEAEKVAGEEKEQERCGGGDREAGAEVAGEEAEEERCGGGGGGAAEGDGEALGRAIAAALGGVMREFDARAGGAARSQGELASPSIASPELDKLLEGAPSPFVMQHAAKISSIRNRVAALNLLLRSVQRRIDNIDRIISIGIQSDTRPPETVETSTLTL
uniref:Biogenesis of lysosome-related organelles complex 1 subunit 7 n=1 Tax=Ananas comosus var. bracteatus TaxID=296719 RepID=A0A6V7NPR4_ANACO|nr:unnamed protein product [Ananas comosus var. bracteatus]